MGQSTARRLALPAGAPLPCCRWGPYREGVVKRSAVGQGSWLDVGLDRDAHIPQVGCCLGLLLLSAAASLYVELCPGVGLECDAHIPQVRCCLEIPVLAGVQVTMYNVLQAGCLVDLAPLGAACAA